MKVLHRSICYQCRRPQSSCMCEYCNSIDTKTKFIILMHPMEYKKVKNGTGRLTHLQLKNSEIIIGVDFTNHKKINDIIGDERNDCFILYPHKNSINLSRSKLPDSYESSREKVLFIIDATWPCSKKILNQSTNLQTIQMLSFDNDYESNFKIKRQPGPKCLSTIESTLELLKLFNQQNIESCDISNFTLPFDKMVEYQIQCTLKPDNKEYR